MANKSEHLGAQIRSARRRAKLTQDEVAALAGVSRPTARLVEQGSGRLSRFAAVARAVGLCVDAAAIPMNGSLGKRLRALRERKGLSRRAISRLTGICMESLATLEDGGDPRMGTVIAVADALDVHLRLSDSDAGGFFARAAVTSGHDAWTTPTELLERLYPLVGGQFDLDPASPGPTRCAVRARRHYTVVEDGMACPWHGTVYLNPPYGRVLPTWLAKAVKEFQSGRASLVIACIPARTDTRHWHEHIAGKAHVVMLRGRLTFGSAIAETASAPFPSALVVWSRDLDIAERLRVAFPDDWHVPFVRVHHDLQSVS